MTSALDRIVKAYDIRGVVPDELNDEIAFALGVALGELLDDDEIVIGRDMRQSGIELADQLSAGLQRQGLNVIDIGLASTDMVYCASGQKGVPAVILTASHNPAQYNGMKISRAGAVPVGHDTGLAAIKQTAAQVLNGEMPPAAARSGSRRDERVLDDFVAHVHACVDVDALAPIRVLADTANGMGGLVVPAVLQPLAAITLEVMYAELDGSFPNHPADPLQPENQADLCQRMASEPFDIGLAFDGDADRVFIVDENGVGLSGSTTTALLAVVMLRKHPGATILHNLICSRAVPETIVAAGGKPIRTRVGHSFIKQQMADTGAVFGGEHSAHYYFANNFRADSGLIAALTVIEEMSRTGLPLSELRKPYEQYVASGEINSVVDDTQAVLDILRDRYRTHPIDELDGVSVDTGDYWFNVRPSNTESLLRLNLEAVDCQTCDTGVTEVLKIITLES